MRVQGHLDSTWSDHFAGLTIRHLPNGRTELTGIVPDQAALYGLLNQARDLGLALAFLLVEPVEGHRAAGGS